MTTTKSTNNVSEINNLLKGVKIVKASALSGAITGSLGSIELDTECGLTIIVHTINKVMTVDMVMKS